jgi:DNA mismatch endonuclease, patch repair protein
MSHVVDYIFIDLQDLLKFRVIVSPMTDILTKKERSIRMGMVKSKNTSPEVAVRKLAWSLVYRYSLHRSDLPGRPDIVLTKHKSIVFVHGCFWHRHSSSKCKLARLPKSNLSFWGPKLEANRLRDRRNVRALKAAGWKILIAWECQMHNKERIRNTILKFLGVNNERD